MFKTTLIAAAFQCMTALALEQSFLNEPHLYVATNEETSDDPDVKPTPKPKPEKIDPIEDTKNSRVVKKSHVTLYRKITSGSIEEYKPI